MSSFTVEDRTGEARLYPVLEYGQPKSSTRMVEAESMNEAVLLGIAGGGREATVSELIDLFGESHEEKIN